MMAWDVDILLLLEWIGAGATVLIIGVAIVLLLEGVADMARRR